MAITLYGAAGPAAAKGVMNEAERARYHELVQGSKHRTVGLAAAVGPGTREVLIASGEWVGGGMLGVSTTQTSLLHDAQASTSRIDTVVFQAVLGNGGAGGSIMVVKGTAGANPQPPTLVQDWAASPTRKWQTPLHDVTITAGQVAFTAASFTDRRPLPLRAIVKAPEVVAARGINSGTPVVAEFVSRDPGWPWMVDVRALVNFARLTAGRAQIFAEVNGVAAGPVAETDAEAAGFATLAPVMASGSGPIRVTLRAGKNTNAPAGELLTVEVGGRLQVTIYPT